MSQIVSYFCSVILYIFQSFCFIKIVLNKKSLLSFKSKLFVIFLISIFDFFIIYYVDGILKSLLSILIVVFIYIFLYKISFFKSLFISFIYMVLILFVELFLLFCSVNVFKIDKEYFYTDLAGTLMGDFLILFCFLFFVFIIRKPLRKIFDTQIDNDKKIVIFSVLTFLCVLLFFYTIIQKFRFSNDILLYLLSIVILVLVLSSSIKQVIENRKLSDKYDKLSEFMTTYEEEIENQRILRHEIKNEFLVVRAKLTDSQKNDDVISYIDEILKDKITVKQEKYAKFGFLPPGIKGLCYFKVQEAENKGINVSINISKKVKEFDINVLSLSQQRNLARILGVFLDNAKEASNVSIGRQMGLEIYYDKNKELKFIISNTFNNEIDVKKMGKEVFSTKGKDRGHGLMLVNYILESNKIFNLKTEINNGVYSQNLFIQLKNK